MLQSSNPVLSQDTFRKAGDGLGVLEPSDTMTLGSTMMKSGILLLLAVLTASMTWAGPLTPYVSQGMVIGASIVALILAFATVFLPRFSAVLAPSYALVKGIVLGAVSASYEVVYPGLVMQAVLLTVSVLGGMLLLYSAGIIRATARFRSVLIAATFGVFGVYMLSFVLGFFGVSVPFIHSNGLIGIGFSLVVVVIAALNLILDFDLIEHGVASRAPKYMEWYAGFALLVTLIWLYFEILRLLSKLRSR